MAAKYAAKGGASTLIIEKDPEIGIPVHCAGLISKRAVEESELKEVRTFIMNRIKGAIIHSPNYDMQLEARESAYAIMRDHFDRALAKEAMNSGAEIITGCKVVGIKLSGGELRIQIVDTKTKGKMEEIGAKVVIGADGVRAGVAEMAGMGVKRNLLSCVQVEGYYDSEGVYAEIFASREIAPGFFAWAIPLNDRIARIGLCIDKRFSSPYSTPLAFLKRFLLHEPHMAKRYRGSYYRYTGGVIPIAAGLKPQKTVKIVKDRGKGRGKGILLVGDAAAQVKPISGGGVYYGLRCGKIAGEVAAKAASTGDMQLLKHYDRRWHREIGKEIAFGIWVHRLRCVLGDDDLDRIFRALGRERRRVEEKGDMDYPSLILREFIKEPEFIKLAVKNIIRYMYIYGRWSKYYGNGEE